MSHHSTEPMIVEVQGEKFEIYRNGKVWLCETRDRDGMNKQRKLPTFRKYFTKVTRNIRSN